MQPEPQRPAPGDWQVTEVPRAYHDSFPKDQRPRLRPVWDVFTWTYILLVLSGLTLAAIIMIGYAVFPGPGVVALS
ncbi:MAG TPA: protease PrsW, partial [Candidatus Corynebacterium avicola]|nr:protease PrsW [Candidatus Corynebacterium avicola]